LINTLIKMLAAVVLLPGLLAPNAALAKDYRTIEWTDLMPADDLEALLNPPEYLNEIEDGSEEDRIASQVYSAVKQANDSAYQRA